MINKNDSSFSYINDSNVDFTQIIVGRLLKVNSGVFRIKSEDFKSNAIISDKYRKKTFGKKIKKLFCRHDYVKVANSHGDIVDHLEGKRTLLMCSKCGFTKWITEFIPCDYAYIDTVFFNKKGEN